VSSNDAKTIYQEMQKQIAQLFWQQISPASQFFLSFYFSGEKIRYLEMVLALPLHGK